MSTPGPGPTHPSLQWVPWAVVRRRSRNADDRVSSLARLSTRAARLALNVTSWAEKDGEGSGRGLD